MFDDRFKYRYKTIPFAFVSRDYEGAGNGLHGNRIFHHHKEMEILIVREGQACVMIEGAPQKISLSKGDVVLIPPLAPHCFSKEREHCFSHTCVCFDLSLLCDRALVDGLEKGSLLPPAVLYAGESITAEVFSHIGAAAEACLEEKEGWELECAAHLSLVFSLLKREGRLRLCENAVRDGFRARVSEILQKEYAEPISSAAVADRLFMSHSYFCRRFRAAFGLRFMEYLAMYRIEKSKDLLLRTAHPVSEIALAVGFQSFSHFTKTFRIQVGEAPSAYRASHTAMREK